MQEYGFRKEKQAYIDPAFIQQTPQGFAGKAAERLCRLEEMVKLLQNEQQMLSEQLQQLREEGKTKSYHFKEKMGRKLVAAQVLDELKRYEIIDET